MKYTKLIISLGAFFSLSASALWFDNMPKLPMFGDFDPNQLRQYYNEFMGTQPDFNRENRMIKEIEDAVMDGDVEYLPLKDGREVFTIFMESEAENLRVRLFCFTQEVIMQIGRLSSNRLELDWLIRGGIRYPFKCQCWIKRLSIMIMFLFFRMRMSALMLP